MPARKTFLLRMEPEILTALQTWAADELRSVNGQIEFLLRRALRQNGRLPRPEDEFDAAEGRSPHRRTIDADR